MLMIRPPRGRQVLGYGVPALVLVLVFVYLIGKRDEIYDFTDDLLDVDPDVRSALADLKSSRVRDVAANETLGFETILALSTGTQWRLSGLRTAADYTGLKIRVPPQPPISGELLTAFKNLGAPPHPGEGSALAWMAHMNILRYIIQSEHTTALIIEDDADWDVSLKGQMRHVSDAMRVLLNAWEQYAPYRQVIMADDFKTDKNGELINNSTERLENETPIEDPKDAPYGLNWDVLWLGNCGDDVTPSVEAPKNETMSHVQTWTDPTVIRHARYIGWAKNSVKLLPHGTRALVRSHGPVCTFAYAVTKTGARNVLELAGAGSATAYDVKLSGLCRDHKLRCLSVTPEIMHDYKPAPLPPKKEPEPDEEKDEDGRPRKPERKEDPRRKHLTSEINAGNGQGELYTEEENRFVERTKGSTLNIVSSARCRALFDDTCLGTP
ncbi:MAG: hypothetical protein M1831_002780 [Alyxoria varia]|nr:MAG: hypothetical protein M1831_002780 [Alyxoria varia]